ncbi:hypothetical protein AAC387_Pa12g0648 [Persea americana]
MDALTGEIIIACEVVTCCREVEKISTTSGSLKLSAGVEGKCNHKDKLICRIKMGVRCYTIGIRSARKVLCSFASGSYELPDKERWP